jgi:hypothetical protein
MSNFAERIISQIDKGVTIFEIARMFGGVQKLLDISKKYPYLYEILETKLGGTLYCSAEGEDGDLVPFSLNFILTDLEQINMDDFDHYNVNVNIIIPEIGKSPALMQMLLSWLDDYLTDMGAEVGSFNDAKLNNKEIWIYAESINGKSFKDSIGRVSDEEVLRIIPENYKES